MTEDETIEDRVRNELVHLGVEHEKLPCDPALADTARFCEHYGIPLEDSANAILIASKKPPGQFALCLVLATTRLDVNHAVRDAMGVKRLSFASADETVARTGMMVGGVTPFGLPKDLPILADARLMERETIILGGGSRSSKLRLSPQSLERLSGFRLVPNLAVPGTD
jgi:prolyl-tRNA editing enzyme YbaK/EbsC (Cys-tRNA(Pro) deacylase)